METEGVEVNVFSLYMCLGYIGVSNILHVLNVNRYVVEAVLRRGK